MWKVSRLAESHPLFARFWTRASGRLERELGRYRKELLEGLGGRALEVGAGDGMNFARYGDAVTEVVALEPEPYLRSRATERAAALNLPITVVDGFAESLPFGDDEFDVVVACLVLCSIREKQAALAEISRVLKPEGSLHFFEHVRSVSPRKARIQSWLDRSGIWPKLSGGCHCSCETMAEIQKAGFSITEVRNFEMRPTWGHTSPSILGSASPPKA